MLPYLPYSLTAHATLLPILSHCPCCPTSLLPCCRFGLDAHASFLPCCLMECCPFFLTANAAHAAYSTLQEQGRISSKGSLGSEAGRAERQ
jgi:hypothetical protein